MSEISRRDALRWGGGTIAAASIATLAQAPFAPSASAAPSLVAADFPASPIDKPGWILTGNDEFNVSGAVLTTNLWDTRYLPHWTNVDTTTEYKIENGTLRLQISPSRVPWDPTHDGQTVISSIQTVERNYLHNWAGYSGIDHSEPTVYRHAQKYGYFEIRARTQRGSGHHSAWWMIGTQSDQGTGTSTIQNTEIDIFEIPGDVTGKIGTHLLNLGEPNMPSSSNWNNVGIDLSTHFHVYGFLWEPGSITVTIDGQIVQQIPRSPDYPLLTLLGLYEKRHGGWSGTFDSTVPYPKSFDIDYWRAYQRTPTVPYSLEAEDADLYGATKVVRLAGASNGRITGYLGNGSQNYAQFSRLWVPTAGNYRLTFRYLSAESRILQYRVNGGTTQSIVGLNSGSWTASASTSVTVQLNAGFNRLWLGNTNAYAPDLDDVTIANA